MFFNLFVFFVFPPLPINSHRQGRSLCSVTRLRLWSGPRSLRTGYVGEQVALLKEQNIVDQRFAQRHASNSRVLSRVSDPRP